MQCFFVQKEQRLEFENTVEFENTNGLWGHDDVLTLLRTAFHEAGHVVVTVLLGRITGDVCIIRSDDRNVPPLGARDDKWQPIPPDMSERVEVEERGHAVAGL